jgi:hypothetical protein
MYCCAENHPLKATRRMIEEPPGLPQLKNVSNIDGPSRICVCPSTKTVCIIIAPCRSTRGGK